MGAIEQTLDALDARLGGACQVVAICGRNKALIQRLQTRCLFLDILCVQQQCSIPICSALSLCSCEILFSACLRAEQSSVQGILWRFESDAVRVCEQHG